MGKAFAFADEAHLPLRVPVEFNSRSPFGEGATSQPRPPHDGLWYARPIERCALTLVPRGFIVSAGQRIPYRVLNGLDETVAFGVDYQLERWRNARWAPCDLGARFRAIGLSLDSGEERELDALIPADLVPGDYRLVKRFRTSSGEQIEATFSFSVSNPISPA
jgi:hypothetical protein